MSSQDRDAATERPDTGRWHVEFHGHSNTYYVSEHPLDTFAPGIVGRFEECDDAYGFAAAFAAWDALRPKVEDFNGR